MTAHTNHIAALLSNLDTSPSADTPRAVRSTNMRPRTAILSALLISTAALGCTDIDIETQITTGGCCSGCNGDECPGTEGEDSCAASADSGDADSSAEGTTAPPTVCGDGILDEGEACDDGNQIDEDECTNHCAFAVCGDGIVGPGEQCDDGNLDDTDGCTNACNNAVCGDGVVGGEEECDDGNDVLGDGCDDCRFTCDDASDCDDADECNGAEACSAAHVCTSGTALEEGAACAGGTGTCASGSCLPRSCATDADCDDADVCNGEERCESTACVRGTALDCDDDDACTADTCGAASGCAHALIDADRDGHAPASLGACGTDCDDASATANPDIAEVCGDAIDNDCNGMVDEVSMTAWYVDCDGDSYAAVGARMISSCARPSAATSMCASGGGWTARAPSASTADCNDGNAAVSPGQTMFQTTAIAGAAMASDYDYDCSATEEQRYGAAGECTGGVVGGCTFTEGWDGDSTPGCGETGTYITACTRTALGCSASTEMRTQSCR